MLVEFAQGKRVVHVGFVDEHRLETKLGQGTWLHARLADAASSLVGIDVEEEGVRWASEHGFDATRSTRSRRRQWPPSGSSPPTSSSRAR